MKKKKIYLAAVLCGAMLAGSLSGCSSAEKEESRKQSADQKESCELMVAAAASLEYAFEEQLIPMFEKAHPEVTVKGTYDSSGKLQTQIEEGLEADIFMSAAMQQMEALTEEKLVDASSVRKLLENQIVLITPSEEGLDLADFTDITKADTIAIGDPASVPAGQYAREALTSLGLWEEVLSKASLGTNVTEVLNWVAEGSAQAGVVYATDAATTEQVKVIAAAPKGSLSEPVIYPAGLVQASANKEEAGAFLEFLQSEEALKVFEKYGFISYEEEK